MSTATDTAGALPAGRDGGSAVAATSLVALAALLRRDLTGGRRGATVLWARTLAILVAGGGALLTFVDAGVGGGGQVAVIGSFAVWCGLLLIGFLLMAPVAVGALRLERAAGMLDLLLLAGLRPATLALGRILSTWLLLLSLLLASLPGLALFSFHGMPSPAQLAVAAVAVASHFLAVSAVAVALSAWARNAGTAVALALLLSVAWIGALVAMRGMPTVLAVLLHPLADLDVIRVSARTLAPSEVVLAMGGNIALAALAWLAAARGLSRRQPKVQRDVLLERWERRRRPLASGWLLGWLLLRRSAPARPAIQAILVGPVALLAVFLGAEAQVVLGLLFLLLGFLVAAAIGATSVAGERERGTWDSFAATSLPGERIAADLLRASLVGSAVPVAAGILLALLGSVSLSPPGSSGLVGLVPAALAALLTWLLAAAAGVSASLSCSRVSAALALALALLLLEPVIVLAGAMILDAVHVHLLDSAGISWWLVLVATAAMGGTWLVVRAGFRTPLRMVLAALPALALTPLPLMLGARSSVLLLAPLVGFGMAGVTLLTLGLRRDQGQQILMGIVLVVGCLLGPVMTLNLSVEHAFVAALGGLGWFLFALAELSGGDAPPRHALVASAVHHGVLLWAIVVIFWTRLDRLIGRAA